MCGTGTKPKRNNIATPSDYTAEGETIVQASLIGPELAAILKKLDISRPKPILAVG